MLELILGSLWFFLPAGVANMTPVILAKLFGRSSSPIDGGRSWRGTRILGDHKTWRGLISGTIAGGVFFLLQVWVHWGGFFSSFSVVEYGSVSLFTGFAIGFGALFGDMVKSFCKRRLNIASGHSWVPFDQIDYVVGGLLMAWLFVSLSWQAMVVIVIAYPLLHIVVNHLSFYLGLRSERW